MTSFADKMRERFAARAAERAAEKACQTQPAPQGAVSGKLPVSGPPPAAKPARAKPARAQKPLTPIAIRKVLNRASEAGAFDVHIQAYREATKGVPRKTKAGAILHDREAKAYFAAVRAAAGELVGVPVEASVSRVIWSKTNQRPAFRTPRSEKNARAARRAQKGARK